MNSIVEPPRIKILTNLVPKFLAGAVVFGTVIFIPAGTLSYWNGWLYLGILFCLMTCAFVWFCVRNPSMLKERLEIHEKEKEQKVYQVVSFVWSVIMFVIPGLDYRYQWSRVPVWLVVVAAVLMAAGYLTMLGVMMQNRYASRVVKIQEGQQLIDTGLYSVVRHPMYLGGIIMFTASPLVLGSYYALLLAPALPLLLAYRIRNEEKVLRAGLAGYEDYARRVRYRLIPYVW